MVPRGTPVTSMGWPVEPSGLLELLQRLHSEYSPTRIFLTENGAAFDDGPGPDGVVHDEPRIAFLRDHVAAAGQAIAAGVPLIGYLVWSLLDNFEWAGLVHVDFETQVRTPKASARWFQGLVESGSSQPV